MALVFVLNIAAAAGAFGFGFWQDRILGPFMPLSWGTLYPLIQRLEHDGLIASPTAQEPQDFPGKQRGTSAPVSPSPPPGHAKKMGSV